MLTRRRRLRGPAFALLALSGAWLGHGLEYLRVAPRVGLGEALGGPLHRAYVVPLGMALAILLAIGGAGWLRLWWAVGRRLDEARAQLRSSWRNRQVTADRSPLAEPSWAARLWALTAGLALAQVAVYVVQENAEAAVAGRPIPGLGAVSGVHWAAPLVHLGVGLALAAATLLLSGLLRRRVRALISCERLVASLAWRRGGAAAIPRSIPARTPRERFGAKAWRRPPPALLTA